MQCMGRDAWVKEAGHHKIGQYCGMHFASSLVILPNVMVQEAGMV